MVGGTLALNRETVRNLQDNQLRQIVGGDLPSVVTECGPCTGWCVKLPNPGHKPSAGCTDNLCQQTNWGSCTFTEGG